MQGIRQAGDNAGRALGRIAGEIRRFGRIAVVAIVMAATVSVASPVADAHSGSGGRHHHPRRHHTRPHHRHHHHRDHRSARTASDQQHWSATGPCPYSDTNPRQATVAEMDAAVACLVNQQRMQMGLPPMNVSDKLNTSAQGWTNTMVNSNNFAHGSDQAFSNRLLAVGFNWENAGENIATGYLTPRDVVAAWMASTGHCQNILEPDFLWMGTGEVDAPISDWAADPATWTQDFGITMSENAISHSYGPANGCPYKIASSPNTANNTRG